MGSRAALIAIVLAMTACSQDRAEAPATSTDRLEAADRADGAEADAAGGSVERIVCDDLETSIIAAAPLTRAGLRERFGTPDSVAVSVEPNRHIQGAIDSLFTVYYPGLEASFRTPTGARDLISSATITSNRYVRYVHIGIGTPVAQVPAALGPPAEQDSTELIYDCSEALNQPVTFRLRDGVVEAISIEYYVD